MVLFMKMEVYRKVGYKMYTKIIRGIILLTRKFSGHCSGDSGHIGHCY